MDAGDKKDVTANEINFMLPLITALEMRPRAA
jgi:hypothetical protein